MAQSSSVILALVTLDPDSISLMLGIVLWATLANLA